MKVIIVENEKLAAEHLIGLLNTINLDIEIVSCISTVVETVNWLITNEVDLIFLDIELADGNAFQIFELLPVKTPIIFTTSHDSYAIKAFELNCVSYLVKPIRLSDLQKSIHKFQDFNPVLLKDYRNLSTIVNKMKDDFRKRFLIHFGNKIVKVESSGIVLFYAFQKTVYLITKENKSYAIDYSLDSLEECMRPDQFFRINRSCIVNIEMIVSMVAWSRGRVKLFMDTNLEDDIDLVVSIDRSRRFKKLMDS